MNPLRFVYHVLAQCTMYSSITIVKCDECTFLEHYNHHHHHPSLSPFLSLSLSLFFTISAFQLCFRTFLIGLKSPLFLPPRWFQSSSSVFVLVLFLLVTVCYAQLGQLPVKDVIAKYCSNYTIPK